MSAVPATGRTRGWARVDQAAFGMVYGSVTALSILMALPEGAIPPLETAVVLFGSVLAITFAKAFAEILARPLDTGEAVTRQSIRAAWRHARDTLTAANLPALFFLGAWLGLWSPPAALYSAQIFATLLLVLVGARVGWRVGGCLPEAFAGGAAAGAVGVILAMLKYVIH